MTASNLIYSQFIREGTFAALWLDFWLVTTIIISFVISILLFKNPVNDIIFLLAIRGLITGEVSLFEIGGYGVKVMTTEELD